MESTVIILMIMITMMIDIIIVIFLGPTSTKPQAEILKLNNVLLFLLLLLEKNTIIFPRVLKNFESTSQWKDKIIHNIMPIKQIEFAN